MADNRSPWADFRTTPATRARAVEVGGIHARFMSQVYAWMTFGIVLTGFVSYATAQTPELVIRLVSNPLLFWGLIIAQFGAVIFLTAAINKVSALTATLVFLAYAALTGLTFSTIFLAYTQESIVNVFAISALAFGGLSAVGYTTQRDLGPIGSFATMGLFGMVGFMLLAMFFPGLNGNTMQQVVGVIGLIVFSGLTAYDTQRIKALNPLGQQGTDAERKGAVYGALILYLDFINLFLSMLRLFGRRR